MKRWMPAAGLAALVLAGCAAYRPGHHPEPEDVPGRVAPEVESAQEGAIMPGFDEATGDPGITETEFYRGSGSMIDEEVAASRAPVVSEDGEIVLNFEGESIQSVVHTILGEVLQESFVIGPGVEGQVTFSTAKPVTREQLMPILEMVLRWNGATLVWMDGRYNVLPISEALRGNLSPVTGSLDAVRGYEVRVFPLRYIAAAEMEKILQPYAREDAIVNVDLARNMLFLAGTRDELANYQRTIDIFDVNWLAGMSVAIYPLQSVDVESITAELTSIFGAEGETPLSGMFRFIPLERLGSVMVITSQPQYLESAQEWINRLDRGAAGGGQQLFVYKVKNLEAPVLAGYLIQLFGGETTGERRESRGVLAPGLEPVQVGSVQDVNANRLGANRAQNGGQAAAGTQVLNTGSGDDVRITSVIETNSLIIQATQQQYEKIRAAITRIDEEPLQVLIESQVMDVTLNETLAYGVTWFLSNNPDIRPEGFVSQNPSGRYIDSAQFGAASGGSSFLSTLIRPFGDGTTFVQTVISALDSVTDVRSLAAPSLLVRNNSEAVITVGTQVPIQSSSISTDNDNVVSSAQYVNTGVTLRVTPRINPGGLVYLDITQEVSSPGARNEDISTSGNPPINNKSVTSQVAVQSGQTVFLGGLIQETNDQGRSGVPYLSRIPGVGALFGA
ncbi:MAG: type II secretion system secretin GspD, partial [Xanthomonadales bacterium]|nr:type II secretion system secretin GspD [Xanthomonadales bacterium]